MKSEEDDRVKIVALMLSGGCSLKTKDDINLLLKTAGFDTESQKAKSAVRKFLKKKKINQIKN